MASPSQTPGQDVPFSQLGEADLVLDAVYAGGSAGHSGDDALARLLPGTGNQGGFRYAGSPAKGTVRLAVLYTSGGEVDWPDYLDTETGTFTYYGDNKTPGKGLHKTSFCGMPLIAPTARNMTVAPRCLRSSSSRRPEPQGEPSAFEACLLPVGQR
jgi:hypothetical protein